MISMFVIEKAYLNWQGEALASMVSQLKTRQQKASSLSMRIKDTDMRSTQGPIPSIHGPMGTHIHRRCRRRSKESGEMSSNHTMYSFEPTRLA